MRDVKAAIAIVILAWSGTPIRADVLVTPEEGLLPAAKGAVALSARGITRGPKIAFVPQGPPPTSPAMLMVKFETYGGATIDLDTVKVTYLRTPNVDVTARVKPFLQPTGIVMPGAELPPGEHAFRVDLNDSGGRTATTVFQMKISP